MAAGMLRLLTVLELLQSRDSITGSEIAARLEVDVRSVRRYILALQNIGIPIEAERGRYGAYRLDRGFRLPPLMFTEHEMLAITLGLMAVRALQFPVDETGAAGALTKIERVMPAALFDRSRALQEALHFSTPIAPMPVEYHHVRTLSIAIHQQQRVHIHYLAWNDEMTERDFDPYGIVLHDGWWYVAGFCHLRRDLRTFRIDRLQHATCTTDRFILPPDFDPVAFVQRALSSPDGIAPVEVIFFTTLENAKRALPPELGMFEAIEGGVRFHRPAYRLEWVAPLLLGLPFPIRIVQPPELIALIRRLGEKALQMTDTTKKDDSMREEIPHTGGGEHDPN